jgi:antitoxin MazE
MQSTIQQWGNSLALRIPKAFARQTKVKKGSRIQLTVEKGRILVTPIVAEEISLESLLAKVTPENIHAETDWGKPKGKEIW